MLFVNSFYPILYSIDTSHNVNQTMIQFRKNGSDLLLRLIVISQLCWYFHLTFATFVDFASDTFCWLIRKKHTFNVKRKQEYFLLQHYWIWMKKSHRKCFRGEELLNLHYARPYQMDITSSVQNIEDVCTMIYENRPKHLYLFIIICNELSYKSNIILLLQILLKIQNDLNVIFYYITKNWYLKQDISYKPSNIFSTIKCEM